METDMKFRGLCFALLACVGFIAVAPSDLFAQGSRAAIASVATAQPDNLIGGVIGGLVLLAAAIALAAIVVILLARPAAWRLLRSHLSTGRPRASPFRPFPLPG
jgi:hypothetical protein